MLATVCGLQNICTVFFFLFSESDAAFEPLSIIVNTLISLFRRN